MPIIIPRNAPIPQSVKDTYTQEQKDKAWAIIIEQNADKLLKQIPLGGVG